MDILIKNFKCYADKKISIPEGIILVKGVSGAGKTTILQAIVWLLYGKLRNVSPRGAGPKIKTIVTMNMSFNTDKKHHITIERRKNPGLFKVVLDEHEYMGDEAQSIIDSYFGGNGILECSSYIPHKGINNILTVSSSERLSILNSIAFNDEDPAVAIKKIEDRRREVEEEFIRKNEDLQRAVIFLESETHRVGSIDVKYVCHESEIQGRELERRNLEGEGKSLSIQQLKQQEIIGSIKTAKLNLEEMTSRRIPSSTEGLSTLRERKSRMELDRDKALKWEVSLSKFQAESSEYEKLTSGISILRERRDDIESTITRDLLSRILTSEISYRECVALESSYKSETVILEKWWHKIVKYGSSPTGNLPSSVPSKRTEAKDSINGAVNNMKEIISSYEERRRTAMELQRRVLENAAVRRGIKERHSNDVKRRAERIEAAKNRNASLRAAMENARIQRERQIERSKEDYKRRCEERLIRMEKAMLETKSRREKATSQWEESVRSSEGKIKSLKDEISGIKDEVRKLERWMESFNEGKLVSALVGINDSLSHGHCPSCNTRLKYKDGSFVTALKDPLVTGTNDELLIKKNEIMTELESLREASRQIKSLNTRGISLKENLKSITIPRPPEEILDPLPEPEIANPVDLPPLNDIPLVPEDEPEIPEPELPLQIDSIPQYPNQDEQREAEEAKRACEELFAIKLVELPMASSIEVEKAHEWKRISERIAKLEEIPVPPKPIEDKWQGSSSSDIMRMILIISNAISREEDLERQRETQARDLKAQEERISTLEKSLISGIEERLIEIQKRCYEIYHINNESLKANYITSIRDNMANMKSSVAVTEERLRSLERMKQLSIETECFVLQDVVDTINVTVSELTEIMFTDPITVTLHLHKELKTIAKTKPYVNLTIAYKGMEYESIDQVSGGEASRISLALTLAIHKITGGKFIMLDESFSTLDALTVDMCLKAIRHINPPLALCINHESVEGIYSHVINVHQESSSWE